MLRRDFLTALALLCAQLGACRSLPVTIANRSSPQHPRLLVSEDEWRSLTARRKADPDLDRFTTLQLERARKDLALPLLERKLEGRRLLGVSREFIRRTLAWAFAYRITGDAAFLERARREMLNVASFANWNPEHYLDVAEMTTGLAIGYDWLFNDLPASERAILRAAIVSKGIAQARNGHKTFRMTNNWSQVCIGGMVLGALAVQEDEPELAADLLAAAQKEVFTGLAAYKPDGAYPEGPGYWSYGTSYSVLLIAALRSAGVADWGVLAAPGFTRSAEFYAHSIGPSGRHFNFADGNEGQELPSPIVYLARELSQPALLQPKREMIRKNQGLSERFAPLSILWWPGSGSSQLPPLAYIGQGEQPVAIWRSSWTDPNALWFAIKGGGAAHNHAHMDAGSFVLDMDGVRWARDLGMQDYNSLESRGFDLWNMKQNSPRWQVFRIGADAHNTLTFDGRPHNALGMATLRLTDAQEALIDLTPALLPGQVQQATRRARFTDTAVSLSDEVRGARPGSLIRWAMATEAEISLDGSTATLRRGGKTLHLRFTGTPLRLTVRELATPPHDYDTPNPGSRQLLAEAPADAEGHWQLAVRFTRD